MSELNVPITNMDEAFELWLGRVSEKLPPEELIKASMAFNGGARSALGVLAGRLAETRTTDMQGVSEQLSKLIAELSNE